MIWNEKSYRFFNNIHAIPSDGLPNAKSDDTFNKIVAGSNKDLIFGAASVFTLIAAVYFAYIPAAHGVGAALDACVSWNGVDANGNKVIHHKCCTTLQAGVTRECAWYDTPAKEASEGGGGPTVQQPPPTQSGVIEQPPTNVAPDNHKDSSLGQLGGSLLNNNNNNPSPLTSTGDNTPKHNKGSDLSQSPAPTGDNNNNNNKPSKHHKGSDTLTPPSLTTDQGTP